jgi:CubicO group peptidase (beta-lactamase class C family)
MTQLSRRQFSAATASSILALGTSPLPAASSSISPAKLESFRRRAFELGVRSLVVANGRRTLLEAGPISEVSRIASIRKSFVSALIGIAAAQGRIKLDSTIGELGIDDYQPLTAIEKTATVRQLLLSRSGVYLPTAAESPAMQAARPRRGNHAPGTFWYYNNWDFNVLGEVYQRATNEDLFGAIEHRIVRPLGFRDFQPLRDLKWGYDESYPRFPSYNMWMSAQDLALFGQLYLNRGQWKGAQLIPEAWVRESTVAHSKTGRAGWSSGYGYMWWVASNKNGATTSGLPAGAFTAAGNGGRYITVFPTHDLVIAFQPHEVRGQPQAEIYTDKAAYAKLLGLLFS